MGIETIIAIGALAATAAATGEQVHQSQVAKADTKDAKRDAEGAARAQEAKLQNAKLQTDATQAARVARMRQQAAVGASAGYDSTIATSPLGLSGGTGAVAGSTGTYGGGTKQVLG